MVSKITNREKQLLTFFHFRCCLRAEQIRSRSHAVSSEAITAAEKHFRRHSGERIICTRRQNHEKPLSASRRTSSVFGHFLHVIIFPFPPPPRACSSPLKAFHPLIILLFCRIQTSMESIKSGRGIFRALSPPGRAFAIH